MLLANTDFVSGCHNLRFWGGVFNRYYNLLSNDTNLFYSKFVLEQKDICYIRQMRRNLKGDKMNF